MESRLPEYIQIVNTRNKKSNLKTIKYKNKFLHSYYDPLEEAERELRKYSNLNQYETIVIFGLGMGYILDAFEKQNLRTDINIICIEYEKNFQSFTERKHYNNPVTLLFHEDRDKVCSFLFNYFDNVLLKEVLFIELKALTSINPEYYQYIKKMIKIRLQQKVADVTTTAYFNEQWLFNSFINCYHLNKGILINELKDKFIDKTALLVSSGPTAEYDIDFIKKFKGYIFCLPPSLNYLHKNNIVPDFIVLGDSNFNNIYHLQNFMKSNIFLVTDLSIHYTLLSKWSGPVILFSYKIPGSQYIYNRHKIDYIPQGGTVASSAIAVMKYMGFNKVILSGQDFAYEDYKLHIRGSGYELYHLKRNFKFKDLNNLNFELIKNNRCEYKNSKIIDYKMKLYKDWFYKLAGSLGIVFENKDYKVQYKKEPLKVKINQSALLKKEWIGLLDRLNLLSNQKTGTVEQFLEDIKADNEVYELIKGFNYRWFLKINQGLSIDKVEFFNNIISSLDKIKMLINYNLREN